MSERPEDGATKRDQAGCVWIACCGVWISSEAWTPPQVDVERDPAEAARTHRVVKEGTTNCPECRRSLRRHEPDAVDAARVLAIADGEGEESLETAYAQRLRDTTEGQWLRFGPTTVLPRASQRIPIESCYEPIENVAFLSLPTSVASRLRVLDVVIGREVLVDGPVPGECFAVRLPSDARRPIDRGGSLRRRAIAGPGFGMYVTVENKTDEPIEVLGALFAPRAPKLSVVASTRVGFDPSQGPSDPNGRGGSCG